MGPFGGLEGWLGTCKGHVEKTHKNRYEQGLAVSSMCPVRYYIVVSSDRSKGLVCTISDWFALLVIGLHYW